MDFFFSKAKKNKITKVASKFNIFILGHFFFFEYVLCVYNFLFITFLSEPEQNDGYI